MDDEHAPSSDDNVADRTQRRTQYVRSQLAAVDRELESLAEERVEGLHGESFTSERADDVAEELEGKIRTDVDSGIHKHTPASSGQRRLSGAAPFTDFLVFLYFLAVVLNVDWNDPRRTPVLAVVALILAVIATAGVAWTLRFLASRLRQDKPDDNRFRWRQRTRQGGVQEERLLLALLLIGVGSVMAYRIYVDGTDSGLAPAPAILLAAFFALIVMALNYVIFLVHFGDGSTVTDEVRHLRAQLEPIEARKTATKRRRRELQQQLELLLQPPAGAAPESADQAASDALQSTGTIDTTPATGVNGSGSAEVIDLDANKRDGATRMNQADPRVPGQGDDVVRRGPRADGGPAPATQ